jgi:pullulanase
MRPYLSIFILALFWGCQSNDTVPLYTTYEDYPVYSGEDLGLSYTPAQSTFKVWAPAAEALRLKLYAAGTGGEPLQTVALERSQDGVWVAVLHEDLLGQYYTFQAQCQGQWRAEVTDPYVKAVGVNGLRGHIIDWQATNPAGWATDQKPATPHPTDMVIYEIQLRDMTIHPSSGATAKGKYTGLTEAGTRSPEGLPTGLDHLKELGITHVHILPAFDHRSIDETRLDEPQYNWGYDPLNYNVPEGSFASDPYDGAVRIREFKQMVQALHAAGIGVILDVVYNHTGQTEESIFNQLVPGYYYRQDATGGFSNASACGNETASERAMFRKYMVESMLYWAREYHLDGFRVDLMGIHDMETMNAVSTALRSYDPRIFLYGEGWKAGDSPLPDEQLALKANTAQLEHIAAFSDEIRDAIKGHVFTHDAPGFISNQSGLEESLKFGIVAATPHDQILLDSVNYSDQAWSPQPAQTIIYTSCHDNHTLWDRLTISRPDASEADKIRMHKLALTIVLTSQGVPFLHAGSDFLRTKHGVENSFESPDSINQIDWSRKAKYRDVHRYVTSLIELRQAHPAFRMHSAADIQAQLRFLPVAEPLLVAYTLDGAAQGDSWSRILVAFNGADEDQQLSIPAGNWRTAVARGEVYLKEGPLQNGTQALIEANSALILYETE